MDKEENARWCGVVGQRVEVRDGFTVDIIIDMNLSADLLREARLRAGLSQGELARRTGRAQSGIARWERGDVEPRFSTLVELVRACGLELTFGLAEHDDSYLHEIDRMLALSPAERVASGTRSAVRLRELRSAIEAARRG